MSSGSPTLGRTGKTAATATNGGVSNVTTVEPRMDYARVIKLFTNEHTADLQDRQVAAVKRVVRVNADGFKLSELPDICGLIDVCAAGVTKDNTVLVPSLVELMNIFQKPLLTDKANQELHATEDVCAMFRLMARMLTVDSALVQLAAIQSLLALATVDDEDSTFRASEDTRATLWAHNHRLFHISGVIESIVAAFKSEVQELLRFDTNADGKVDESEYYRFRVTNDAAADNDADTLAAKQARDAAEAAVSPGVKPEVSEGGDGEEAPEMSYFLATIVTLLKELSEHSESAATIVRLGALPFAARVLAVVEDFREPVVMTVLELLWNCLEHSYANLENGDVSLSLKDLLDKRRASNASFQLGTLSAVTALKAMLHRTLAGGHRKSDRELRNTVLIVATLLARRKENRILFLEAGFVDMVLLYGCAAEMALPTDTNARYFSSTDEADHQFKVLLWSFIGIVTGLAQAGQDAIATPAHKPYQRPPANAEYEEQREAVLVSVRSSLFLHTLLTYLDPLQSQTHPYVTSWSPAQGRALDLVALKLLHCIAPRCLESFLEASGPQVLGLYLRKFCNVLSLSATASAVDPEHAASLVDGDADVDRVYLAVRVLQAVVVAASKDEAYCDKYKSLLGEIGVIEDLIAVAASVDVNAAKAPFASTVKVPTGTAASVTVETSCPTGVTPVSSLEAVFGLIGALCAAHRANKTRFRRGGGVPLLASWLRFPTGDLPHKPQVVVAAVHCLWNAVSGAPNSENKFVAEGGVDALIDLLESCPPFMRGQVLGCLADLALNPNVVPYLKIWKSDTNGRSFGALLLSFWPEDAASGAGSVDEVPSGTLGLTSDASVDSLLVGGSTNASSVSAFDRLRRALKASKMWKQVAPQQPELSILARITADDVRPKVFAVLSTMGFENAEDGVAGNFDDLSPRERATLCAVSRFPDTVYGREWTDVLVRLSNRRLVPIESDMKLAEGELESSSAAAAEVQVQQEQLEAGVKAKMSEEDEKFFGSVLARRFAEEQSYSLAKRRIGMGSMGLQEWLAAKSRLAKKK